MDRHQVLSDRAEDLAVHLQSITVPSIYVIGHREASASVVHADLVTRGQLLFVVSRMNRDSTIHILYPLPWTL